MEKIPPQELKPYPLNKEFFDALPKSEYGALKADIERRGITNDLHITKGKTILTGHQRHKVALELGLPNVPCKIVDIDEADELAVKEYVIKDNLLRRHLKPEQRAVLEYELYKVHEKQPGKRTDKTSMQDAQRFEPIHERLSKETGQNVATITRHIQFAKAIEAEPDRFKGKKVSQVLREIKKGKQTEEIKKLTPVKGKFHVIVCDPPWKPSIEYHSEGMRGEGDYPTMSLDELKAITLPVEKDCILWLWVADYWLKDALELLDHWGFERRATLIWVKDKFGLGKYLRNQHEYCFLATKGKPLITGERTSTVLNAPRRGHSEKPNEFYKLVEEVCPYPAKLDYFARKNRQGWTVFGDEVKPNA